MKLLTFAFILSACAPNLDKTWEWNDEDETILELLDTASDTGEFDLEYRILVDATSREDWVLLDLENGDLFEVEDSSGSSTWDLSIQRFILKLNCPLNGPEDAAAQVVLGETYEDYEIAPLDGYIQDTEDNNDDGVPEYVFNEWYDYDMSTHILTPKQQFYIVRNRNDRYFKLQIENYYSSAGTSAMITLAWAEIFTTENPSE